MSARARSSPKRSADGPIYSIKRPHAPFRNTSKISPLDVVATGEGRAVLVGECKWSAQPADRRELEGLRAGLYKAAAQLNPIDRPWRAVFSRSGFSEELNAVAANAEERVLLFGPEDLY